MLTNRTYKIDISIAQIKKKKGFFIKHTLLINKL